MIGKVCKRGSDAGRLLAYLFREGLAGERGLTALHTAPRLIAAWDGTVGLEPSSSGTGCRDLRQLAAALNAPLLAAGMDRTGWKSARPVYHLAIAAAKDDRVLDDDQWAEIVQEYLHRIGLAPRGDDTAVRWVAVRHADDHVHVVATLARQDGRRVWPRNDFYRSREASLAVEARYGLCPTSPADRTGTQPVTRAEQRKHDQTAARRRAAGLPGPSAPDRQVLRQQVRACAAGASSLKDFLARLCSEGLLVRERFSEHTPGQITGYAVALPDRYDSGASPIFFGGGKLAPDLTVPKLQQRWAEQPGAGAHAGFTGSWLGPSAASAATGAAAGAADRGGADRFGLTVEKRQRIYARATRAASEATQHILDAAHLDPNDAADAAWAASDFLAAAARVVEGRRGGPLTAAAREYDRAARELFGRTPTRTAAGNGLRMAGRLLFNARVAKPSENQQLRILLGQLAALVDAVARLRQIQHRAAQAAAARAAAEQLLAAAGRYTPPPSATARPAATFASPTVPRRPTVTKPTGRPRGAARR